MPRRPSRSTLFPYTTLFRSLRFRRRGLFLLLQFLGRFVRLARLRLFFLPEPEGHPAARTRVARNKSLVVKTARRDRKSTRLNSSHSSISYAVFCLKKKKNNR